MRGRLLIAVALTAMVSTPIAVLTLFATLASAQKANVDWKFYGRAVLNERKGKIELSCFFDANSIDFPTDGHLRVWTKCMDEKDMHNFDYHSDLGKKIIKAAAQKIIDYYIPPYAVIDDVSIDIVKSIVADEQLADLIQPVSRIFYEFNCQERMVRELSISMLSGSKDRPTNWQYTRPESNGANLNKLLCDEGIRKMMLER